MTQVVVGLARLARERTPVPHVGADSSVCSVVVGVRLAGRDKLERARILAGKTQSKTQSKFWAVDSP